MALTHVGDKAQRTSLHPPPWLWSPTGGLSTRPASQCLVATPDSFSRSQCFWRPPTCAGRVLSILHVVPCVTLPVTLTPVTARLLSLMQNTQGCQCLGSLNFF